MKVEIQGYQKSINQSSFSLAQAAMIWDFYVTKSVASSASQKRTVNDYDLKLFPWKEMLEIAQIDKSNVKILPANSINKTLAAFDLEIATGTKTQKHNREIEIDIPKIVCLTPYTIADEDKPKAKCGEAESVLTHIRNAFAHGLTYFFDNGNVLFEDRNNYGTITARIILKQQTLLDWITLIDHTQKYYVLHDFCKSCSQQEGPKREAING